MNKNQLKFNLKYNQFPLSRKPTLLPYKQLSNTSNLSFSLTNNQDIHSMIYQAFKKPHKEIINWKFNHFQKKKLIINN